jgi:hypothetical protein
MDYYKFKLLFIVLTSKLIAAQNLNNLTYGELSRDDDFSLCLFECMKLMTLNMKLNST